MKEATTINVQSKWSTLFRWSVYDLRLCATDHVEEFKRELTREVLQMTEEVGRLQRQKQDVEHKIADLFAFYSKQKQSTNEVSI